MTSQKGLPIFDAHMHVAYDIPLEEGLENFAKRMKGRSIAGGTLMGMTMSPCWVRMSIPTARIWDAVWTLPICWLPLQSSPVNSSSGS